MRAFTNLPRQSPYSPIIDAVRSGYHGQYYPSAVIFGSQIFTLLIPVLYLPYTGSLRPNRFFTPDTGSLPAQVLYPPDTGSLPAPVLYPPEARAAGIGPTDTIVFLIEVISASTPLTTATGVAVPPKAGLPTATVDGAKSANITVRKTAVPTKLVVPWRSSSTSLPRPEPSFRSLQWTVLADPDGDLREIR